MTSGRWLWTNSVQRLGIEPEGEQRRRHLARPLAQHVAVVRARQRVVVDDAVDRLVLGLEPDVVADRAEVVAEVDDARRLDAARRSAAAPPAPRPRRGPGLGRGRSSWLASVADGAHPAVAQAGSATIRPMSRPAPAQVMSGARCASRSSARGPSGARSSAPSSSGRAELRAGRRRAAGPDRASPSATSTAPSRRASRPRCCRMRPPTSSPTTRSTSSSS